MVISIISLLSSVIFSYVGSARAKARDSVRLSDMKQISTAGSMYYEDKGTTPEDIDVLVSTGYLSATPKDPKTNQSYSFTRGNSNKTVVVNTPLETEELDVGAAIGEVTTEILCNSTFASSTGCSGGIIKNRIVGISSGHKISLIWSNNKGSLDWYGAFSLCNSLGDNWRLPTVDEIKNAVINDFKENNSSGRFLNNQNYWSSKRVDFNAAGIYVNNGVPVEQTAPPIYTAIVYCVK